MADPTPQEYAAWYLGAHRYCPACQPPRFEVPPILMETECTPTFDPAAEPQCPQ